MADILRIKRRAVGGAAGAPASLSAAELAFNEQDNVLYYGKGNSGGLATSIIPIAGPGGFLPLTGGTLTGALTDNVSVTSPTLRATGSLAVVQIDNRATSVVDWSLYATGGSFFLFNGTNKFTLTSAGALTIVAGFTATTGIFSGLLAANSTIDGSMLARVNGVTKAVRLGATSTAAAVEAVDQTGLSTYQPMIVGGSTLQIPCGLTVGVPTGGDKGAGTVNATGVYAQGVVLTSDARLKRDIEALPCGCLSLVEAIEPVRFRWIEPEGPLPEPELGNAPLPLEGFYERYNWGFTAQDIAAAMKTAGHDFGGHHVDREGNEGYSLSDMIAVLWQAVRELAAKIS